MDLLMSAAVPSTKEFGTTDLLAFERTRLAHERTMMAWIRTATALITFGFAIYKVFEFVPLATGLKPGEHAINSRAFAFFLAFLGNLTLFMAAIQHRKSMQALRALGLKIPYSSAAVLAALLSVLGIAVLLMVLLRC
jgi:putative membrane protein